MKFISTHGWCYLVYGLVVSGYFLTAAASRWPAPVMPDLSAGQGGYSSSGGSSYGRSFGSSSYRRRSGSSSYGRSFGGSWGGGK